MPSYEMSESQLDMFETLAMFLNVLFIGNDKKRCDRHFHRGAAPSATGVDPAVEGEEDEPHSILNAAIYSYSALHRFIHCLSYGEPLKKCTDNITRTDETGAPKKEPHWNRLVATTFAVTDVMRFLRSEKPGLVKDTIDQLLPATAADNAIYKFLNQIGISSSQKTVKRMEQLAISERLLDGIIKIAGLSCYSHLGNYHDNCGYKTGGINVGYLQTVLTFWVVWTIQHLMNIKIYPNPEKGETAADCLSREPNGDLSWWNVEENEKIGRKQDDVTNGNDPFVHAHD
jgi:hypothetical protein